MTPLKLQGKVAIVTGSSRGIGKGIASLFAEEGAIVVVNARQDVNAAMETAREIRSKGGQSLVVIGDVSTIKDVQQIVDVAIKKFGQIDILVNNAGIFRSSSIEDVSLTDWNDVMNVNLRGPFLCSQYVGRHMMRRKQGVIINISSIAGFLPEVYAGAYSPSKAGLISLTQLFAIEWAKYNIRVNAICPGPIETALQNSAYTKRKRNARIKAIPLSRYGRPGEVAKAALYLASDASSYITGHALVLDGGSSLCLYHLIHMFGLH